MKIISVSTGNIVILPGENGKPMECLSIGDYGKEKNIKADFMGLTREIEGVPDGPCNPLSDKWVITISTQYGCSMNCNFCDVPKVGPGANISKEDMNRQVAASVVVGGSKNTKRLNIHYARMGEPTWNPAVLAHAFGLIDFIEEMISAKVVHPVLSTMLPKKNTKLLEFLMLWCWMKNRFYGSDGGDAGLQLSINSTDENQRQRMFGGNAETMSNISDLGRKLPFPAGRKYALNFALADGYFIDAGKLVSLFDPAKFMVKITPMHLTQSCKNAGIKTSGGYDQYTPYKDVESRLKNAGFDVLVFVPSKEEDESKITCGNAILAEQVKS